MTTTSKHFLVALIAIIFDNYWRKIPLPVLMQGEILGVGLYPRELRSGKLNQPRH
jgi:hypothetical protein